jgi:FlaA1/EpsC-like NDP-sugar epimerase
MIFIDYNKVASRWLIFGIEQVLAGFSFLCAFLISGQFRPVIVTSGEFALLLAVNSAITAVGMLLMQTHAGIIRYSSFRDVLNIMKFAVLQFLLWMVVFPLMRGDYPRIAHPTLVFLLNAVLSSLAMIGFRILIKEVFRLGKTTRQKRYNVLIYGANSLGISTMRAVEMESDRNKNVIAFVDDSRDRVKKSISGKRVISADPSSLSRFIKGNKVMELILADDALSSQRKDELLSVCSENGIRPTVIPPISQWINGRIRTSQIKEMTIESILNREAIKLHNEHAENEMRDAVVLVTGAAGSIGSEICRQLSTYPLRRLVLLDCSESGLHDIVNEITLANRNSIELCLELANIRDEVRMREVMSRHSPDIVYHAAAYKHVPILENFPSEVIQTNVMGTMILSEAALQNGVRKFVMISTDKAVNPTNIMGASKRLAEIYVHSLESRGGTQFITTRFGNVLGSNGSVVPLFRQQIAKGGPVTVTHPDITRFFMTIPEASSLVIEASIMGVGGEIFVFDMGKPERIHDMARKMIQLAGYKPDIDIRIEFSGLRKGEKLHEELFKSEENPLPTHHPKIMKAQQSPVPPRFGEMLSELVAAGCSRDSQAVRSLIRRIVPEYVHEQEARDVEVKLIRPVSNTHIRHDGAYTIGSRPS